MAVGDAELLAVCAGPGSFTGLRIGMALVKGLAMATGAQCAPVSTLEALACIAPGAATVVTALDARRGQVYAAAFENTPNGPVRLLPDDACSPAALADFVAGCKKPLVFVGDGAEICYNKMLIYAHKAQRTRREGAEEDSGGSKGARAQRCAARLCGRYDL